jgi:hypothetical protein
MNTRDVRLKERYLKERIMLIEEVKRLDLSYVVSFASF